MYPLVLFYLFILGMMVAGPVVAVAGGIVAGMMAANNEGQGGEVGKEGGKEGRNKKGT